MTKLQKLNKKYEEFKAKGIELECIILDIHMPTGEIENIVNPNVEEKIKYINKTYDENLVHPSCKDIFITDYLFVEEGLTYDFGWAVALLKDGAKLRRKGWNGKGMFVAMQKGYPQGIPCNKQTAEVWSMKEGDLFKCNPYFQIKNVDGTHSMWVPSTGDLLAEDWEEVK